MISAGRVHIIEGKFEPIQYELLWHPGFIWVWLWGCFTILGYVLSLYTTATYATAALGLSQSQGATIQSILAAGQIFGRPLAGLGMDRWGRINIAIIFTFIAGFSCFVIWMLSRSFGVLGFFAFLQGKLFKAIYLNRSNEIHRNVRGDILECEYSYCDGNNWSQGPWLRPIHSLAQRGPSQYFL